MPDLSKVKKGDSVAVVHSGGHTNATTAEKAVVVKKNPASVIINHKGKEIKVSLDGHGVGYGTWVEPWDDANELQRLEEAKLFHARQALVEVGRMYSPLGRATLSPKDVVREPEKFAELVRLRAEFLQKNAELCQEILASRPKGE